MKENKILWCIRLANCISSINYLMVNRREALSWAIAKAVV